MKKLFFVFIVAYNSTLLCMNQEGDYNQQVNNGAIQMGNHNITLVVNAPLTINIHRDATLHMVCNNAAQPIIIRSAGVQKKQSTSSYFISNQPNPLLNGETLYSIYKQRKK